ncbi:MAG TPA: TraR/DksA family transcriptional regulator [Nocardioidaceae bacterium]|nr:TraR/DksA family transcriptional regulator [Nocardioidaceae bacterium]
MAQPKSSTKKSAAKLAAAKKAPVKKAAAKKTTAKKTVAKKATKKTPAKKAPAKKAAAKKAPAKRAAKKEATKKGAAKNAVKKAAKKVTKKAPAKKAPAKKAAAKKAVAKKAPFKRNLVVLPNEKPWTAKELGEVRGQLEADRERFRVEVSSVEQGIQDLLRAGGDGAGNDQADVGSTSLERDAEMSLANNTRDMLIQTERALERLEDRTYGVCESCGNPIGKRRLMVFPRATLCMTCKQREERR